MARSWHRKSPRLPISPVHDDLVGGQGRLRELKGSFEKASGRWDNAGHRRQLLRTILFSVIVIFGTFALVAYLY